MSLHLNERTTRFVQPDIWKRKIIDLWVGFTLCIKHTMISLLTDISEDIMSCPLHSRALTIEGFFSICIPPLSLQEQSPEASMGLASQAVHWCSLGSRRWTEIPCIDMALFRCVRGIGTPGYPSMDPKVFRGEIFMWSTSMQNFAFWHRRSLPTFGRTLLDPS
jgi:hypothetical protein